MKILTILLLVILSISGEVQNGKYRIKVEEYDLTLIPKSCRDSIFKKDEQNNLFFKIFLKDCKGAMKLECYNLSDSTLKEKGEYTSSLALLSSYISSVNGTTGETKILVSKYYQPLRDGIWEFYDSAGIKSKIYKRGILVVPKRLTNEGVSLTQKENK
ncbi:MAG: hypothetical protein H3C64_15360 [Candidatus Kuenenia stuttgartiensis]|nr:hypothetical protein [Candidatus Kuenenia stuttgartiensis]